MKKYICEKVEIFMKKMGENVDDYKLLAHLVDENIELTDEVVEYLANRLGVFTTTLESTINFYPKLKKARVNKYIEICIGKNCENSGIYEELDKLKGRDDVAVEERHCLGKCGKSSKVKIGDEVYSYKTVEEFKDILKETEIEKKKG